MIVLSAWFLRARRLSFDVLLCVLAYSAVTFLPNIPADEIFSPRGLGGFILDIGIFAGIAALMLGLSHSYRMIWRYVSFHDLLKLTQAMVLAVLAFCAIELLVHPALRDAGTLWLAARLCIASIVFLAAPRVLSRALGEMRGGRPIRPSSEEKAAIRVLLTGDVHSIEAFIRETRRNSGSAYHVVGIFSDNSKLYGSHLQGVDVIGPVDNLYDSVSRLRKRGVEPEMLVLAREKPTREEFEHLLDLVSGCGLDVGQVPSFDSLQDERPVRPVVISDLLGRPEIVLDNSTVLSLINGRNIFVTGAGGSIGSELCRQIAALGPASVVLADSCEYNLYKIEMEFQEKFPHIHCQSALLDIRDATLVLQWVRKFRPDIVFHAAALKHVPLLEDHPIEAVKTNVLGTVNVADACHTCGVPLMVTISTDKAVNPPNVMGATKRLAEAYCQGLDQSHKGSSVTRYVTVRFGNVLGSAGSVVPLFQRQIEEGGPVTVTHADITRYFMTIPEAVCLVLQASAQGKGDDGDRGSIYVLDMGQPVKIMDLARQMIRLSGKRPDIDIKVKVVGLRPGEKLFEEVVHAEEDMGITANKSVFKVTPRVTDLRILQQQIQELRSASAAADAVRIPRLLTLAVPEYGEALKIPGRKTSNS